MLLVSVRTDLRKRFLEGGWRAESGCSGEGRQEAVGEEEDRKERNGTGGRGGGDVLFIALFLLLALISSSIKGEGGVGKRGGRGGADVILLLEVQEFLQPSELFSGSKPQLDEELREHGVMKSSVEAEVEVENKLSSG